MNLGENIKNRREELKLSQEYVADQLGITRQAVSKWETGQSEPTASNLIQLAEVFEISLSELTDPQRNVGEQSTSEKELHEKNPNPILRANLTKWAIIFQVAFLNSSAVHIHAYLNNMEDKVYFGLIIFDLIIGMISREILQQLYQKWQELLNQDEREKLRFGDERVPVLHQQSERRH